MPETADAHAQLQSPAAAALQGMVAQARALHGQGKLAEAERLYADILRQQPAHFVVLHLLGVIAMQTQRAGRAIELFDKALALKPDFAEAYTDRGVALRKLKRHAEALASYDRAIAIKPDLAMAHNNRATVLLDLKRPAEALAGSDEAIALSPTLAIAHYNRGNALRDLRRPVEAMASYDMAIALKPDLAEAYWDKSLCLLSLGRFEQGWPLYEWRKKRDEAVATRAFPRPLWLGEEDIKGKTLLLWSEQGQGDTIQFCRYAKRVEARGANVVMSVQPSLLALLQRMDTTIEFIGEKDVPSDYDYHCPLLSLPLAFRTTLETIPAEPQYLKADQKLRATWAARLPPTARPRIGLVWSGTADHKSDHARSIELERLLPIVSEDFGWISLQKEIRDKDLAVLRQSGRVAFFGDELRDFSETAALLDLTDLVITVDTSVAHLAGAMGKPVWLLLSAVPDWRWLLDRDDSPWYPSARLFRQHETGDWAAVIERVKDQLRSVRRNGQD